MKEKRRKNNKRGVGGSENSEHVGSEFMTAVGAAVCHPSLVTGLVPLAEPLNIS